MANPLLVGVDVHQKRNYFCLLDSQGQPLARFSQANSRPGAQRSAARLAQALAAGGCDSLRLAAEATNWYWFPFFQALSQDPALAPWPQQLYPLNPRLTAKYKEAFSDLDKDDPNDSFVIADRLRMGRDLPPAFAPELDLLALRCLTRYRYHVVRQVVRVKAYYLSLLFLKLSEYRSGQPFSDVFGAASQAVLAEFASPEEIVACPLAELAERIDQAGRRRFADPEQTARELRQVAQDSYPPPKELRAALTQVLGWAGPPIAFGEGQLRRVERAIATAMEHHPNPLITIRGFGPVFSAGIIAEIGDGGRFAHDEAKVAQYAGLHWRHTQSGDFQADDTPLTKRGNHYLRYYLCEAANSMRLHDPEYTAYYQRKYQEVRQHAHQRAVVLTARKLVRLVVRLLTTNQSYRPGREAQP